MPAHVLDDPIRHAFAGRFASFVRGRSPARQFDPAIASFASLDEPADAAFAALGGLLAHGGVAILFTTEPVVVPAGLEAVRIGQLQQMWAPEFVAQPAAIDLVPLTAADVPEMVELVKLTEPGPFAPRTIEFGGYVGIKDQGRLVGMTGERLSFPGYSEVSAVCTHPDYRGRGFAKALVSHVAGGIAARGDVPFLHVFPHNAAAIATYERLGFTPRRLIELTVIRRPA
jgi:ribosomal protein S18 acetylase RimI-like enzyme